MLHSSPIDENIPPPQRPAQLADGPPVQSADRSAPRWAVLLGAIFTFGGSLCLFALIVLIGLFQTLVAIDGEVTMVPVLIGVAAVLLLAVLTLEFSHIRALAGFPLAREENARRFRAWAAMPAALMLTVLHPLLGLAIPLGIAAGYGALKLLFRWSDLEPNWDYLPSEAVAILSGRDQVGAELAGEKCKRPALSHVIVQVVTALTVICAIAMAAYLSAEGILAITALLPISLVTLIVVHAALQYAQHDLAEKIAAVTPQTQVVTAPANAQATGGSGLDVQGLNLRDHQGKLLLSELSFNAAAGSLTGIIGDSGAGKSLLLQALSDPFSLVGMDIRGHVRINGTDPWERQATSQSVPSVLVNSNTVLLPASGQDNLTCFHSGALIQRGKWLLEQLVFSPDIVADICAVKDARTLASMHQKALALARAFLLSPAVYLLDRPEEGLPDAQIAALLDQIKRERRLGKSLVMVSNNRALLDACDRLITLQDGRIVDFGPADQVRQRMETGWMRFVGERRLDIEANLEAWVRSHFRRGGEEANRRKACAVASELLALSCQGADQLAPGNFSISFKHFKGFCLMKLKDTGDPIGTAQLALAQQQANADRIETGLSPLAVLTRDCLEILSDTDGDHRVIQAKVATYDPRKAQAQNTQVQGGGINDKAQA